MTDRHLYSSEPEVYVEIPLEKDEEFRFSRSHNKKLTQIFGSASLATRDEEFIDVSPLRKASKKWKDEISSKADKLLKDIARNKRYCIFTWLQLEYFHDAKFSEANAGNSEEMQKDIELFILNLSTSKAEKLSEDLMASYLKNSINPEKTKWTTKTPRSIRWVLRKITPLDIHKTSRFTNLAEHDLLLAILDFSHLSLREKDLELNSLKSNWQENIKSDIQLDWFKSCTLSESKQRRELFWNYVRRTHKNHFSFDHTPTKYEDIEEICDQLSEAGFSKRSISNAVKKDEKDAREGITRKNKCFALSLSSHEQFSQLRRHYQMKNQELLDKLIADAYAVTFEALGDDR